MSIPRFLSNSPASVDFPCFSQTPLLLSNFPTSLEFPSFVLWDGRDCPADSPTHTASSKGVLGGSTIKNRLQEYLAHNKEPPPQDHYKALGIILL